MQKCTAPSCGKVGATLGCANKYCNMNYHQPCAVEIGCHLNWGLFLMHCPLHVRDADQVRPVVNYIKLVVRRTPTNSLHQRLHSTGCASSVFDQISRTEGVVVPTRRPL